MEWPKLKNIIILILLLANLFMVSLVLVQKRDSVRYQEQALENAVGVLESSGIRVDSQLLPGEMELTVLTAAREAEGELALAQALLGECAVTELGGGRYAYAGAQGSAEFRSNGNFSVTFSAGARNARKSGGEEEHAAALLKEAGMTAVQTGRTEADGRLVLTFCQTWKVTPVYSCVFTMEYESGSLRAMSGLRLMGEPQAASGGEPISVPTALMRILNGIGDLGDVCGEITAMEAGYEMTAAADELRLIPVWRVTTDTGAYILNALNGALERAE